jgi:ElaB/YqjD/DUF883 family membrane-anchored ribosome-binding protein
MQTTQTPSTSTTPGSVGQFADRAARKAEQALDSTQQVANSTLDSLKETVASARETAPAALSRAAEQVQELTRRGIERARDMSTDVRDKAQRAGDRTVGYIQDEPLKAVLIAAAAGAAVALLIRALSGRNSD